jgi:hypothetical protein
VNTAPCGKNRPNLALKTAPRTRRFRVLTKLDEPMLLCRNGFLYSTRRLLTGSLTLALAYPLISVAQDSGHVRGASHPSVSGPWQLYSLATGLDLAVYADFATCRQAAVTGPDMSCKPATVVVPPGPTPPIVQPPIVTPPTMNSAFRIDASDEQRLPHRRQRHPQRR